MLFALGAAESVLAVSHECDYPFAARSLPRATFSRIDAALGSGAIDAEVRARFAAGEPLYGIDADLLRRLRPDLIVTQAQCDICAIRYDDVVAAVADSPELAGCEIVTLQPTSLADVLHDILRLGAALGRDEAAIAFVRSLQERLDRVRERVATTPERPRVVCLEWFEPLMAAGNWTPELIELAGGVSGLAAVGLHSEYIGWDLVRAFDPDVLLAAPCGFDLPRALAELPALTGRPGWNALKAVRAGRGYAVDGNAYFNRSGPRLVDTVELLAGLLHPDRCPPAFADAYRQLT